MKQYLLFFLCLKTNYNLFRDYNASLGRYIQSDPIGLSGGLNSYAYAGQNPLIIYEQNGLIPSLNQAFVDFFSGFGDSASFGITYFIRDIGDFNEVNMCSSDYYTGEIADVMINLSSYGLSMYLRHLIKNFTKNTKENIRKNLEDTIIYKSLKKKGYEVHHINPLYGHKNLKGLKAKRIATFPTAGLNIKYHTSKYNLKPLLLSEHEKVHANLMKLEYKYEVYQSISDWYENRKQFIKVEYYDKKIINIF